jgi:hypothetical protein
LPHILLSDQPQTNAFIKDGRWIKGYLPIGIRRYPFSFQFSNFGCEVCLDEAFISHPGDNTEAITDQNGQLTESGRIAQKVCLEFANGYRDTVTLCRLWQKRGLFEQMGNHFRLSPDSFYTSVNVVERFQWEPLVVAHWYSLCWPATPEQY